MAMHCAEGRGSSYLNRGTYVVVEQLCDRGNMQAVREVLSEVIRIAYRTYQYFEVRRIAIMPFRCGPVSRN
jgi:hypothetical protein